MIKKSLALLLIVIAIYWSFSALLPSTISDLNTPKTSFSTERALEHLKVISKKPHYVGNPEHKKVRDYIISQLEALGLTTEIQEGYSISKWGNITKPKNILARLKGSDSGKALLLLTHYDSNPHSSLGASDAGSGVVTILEGIRAFLAKGKTPKNDIIILISDAEELGLNGADLFVNQHEWAKDIGLVLNFEARGSGGPSYMLIETNGGNANLMKGFVKANPQFPVANSLAYSIYKMLPNDTDLTRFREDANIDGFNFAFIDDHFDYHTALDTYARLDRNTLEHQGSYFMPLLNYFAEANLHNLKSKDDYIYFNMPVLKTVIYPFAWILPMLILAILAFITLLLYGFKHKKLKTKAIAKGFMVFILSVAISGILAFCLWLLIKELYPQYKELLHGFTYNGHAYILAFVLLTISCCCILYHKAYTSENVASIMVAPLFFWILICVLFAIKLKGASFFIIPVFFGLIAFWVLMRQKKPNLLLMALLSVPTLLILSPFVKMFPVGLGLNILFVSATITALIFSLLIPVFGFFKHKNRWSLLFLIFGVFALSVAHFNSEFKPDTPKPNSLFYVLDTDNNNAFYATYDVLLDNWTKASLSDDPNVFTKALNVNFASKYGSGLSYTKPTNIKPIALPKVEISNDTVIGDYRHFNICVMPQRDNVNRFEVLSDSTNKFKSFKINGVNAYKAENDSLVFTKRWKNRLFSYYVVDNEPLDLQISVPKGQKTKLQILESSNDLLENPLFSIPKRPLNMIPKPFVLNDAVIVKKTLVID